MAVDGVLNRETSAAGRRQRSRAPDANRRPGLGGADHEVVHQDDHRRDDRSEDLVGKVGAAPITWLVESICDTSNYVNFVIDDDTNILEMPCVICQCAQSDRLRCGPAAQTTDGITWSCVLCKTNATRFLLERLVLEDADALLRFMQLTELELVGS